MTTRLARAGLILLWLLAGCASVPPQSPLAGIAGEVRQPYGAIDLGGRLSVRYQKNGREEAIHGSFSWSQRGDRTLVTLLSPLGQTLATIDIAPMTSTLTQAGLPTLTAADPNKLATDALGWPLPVAGLRDWLQGIAIDAAGKRLSASPASSTAIVTSDGWHLQYPSWDTSGPAGAHPKRIDLSRSTAQAGEVAIRIVIDSWQPI